MAFACAALVHLQTDAAAFVLNGTLAIGGAAAAAAGAAPDPKRPKGPDGAGKGKGGAPAFTATVRLGPGEPPATQHACFSSTDSYASPHLFVRQVLQSAPGELTVRANILSDAAGNAEAQAAFARAFAGLSRALRERWPQPQ